MSTTKRRQAQADDHEVLQTAAQRWRAIREEVQHMRTRLVDLEQEAAQARQQRIAEAAAALAKGEGGELPERTTEREYQQAVGAGDIRERIASLEQAALMLAAPAMEELHEVEEAELQRMHARALELTEAVCGTWQRLNADLAELTQLHGQFKSRIDAFNKLHKEHIGTPAPWRTKWPTNLAEMWTRIRGAASAGSIGQYRNTRPLTVEAVLYPHAQNAAKAVEEQAV